jgi:hypothetical protein
MTALTSHQHISQFGLPYKFKFCPASQNFFQTTDIWLLRQACYQLSHIAVLTGKLKSTGTNGFLQSMKRDQLIADVTDEEFIISFLGGRGEDSS